jgi:hypothetical protein
MGKGRLHPSSIESHELGIAHFTACHQKFTVFSARKVA